MAVRTPIFKLLIVLLCLAPLGRFWAQPVIALQERRATPVEAAVLESHFSGYTLSTLDPQVVADLLRSAPAFDEIRLEAAGKVFRFALSARDIRDAGYTLRVATDQGIVEMPRSRNKTYAGYTLRGSYPVRITSDDAFFSGMIGQADGFIFIEPLSEYIRGAAPGEYILYKDTDALAHFSNENCGIDGHHHVRPSNPDLGNDSVTEGHEDARRVCKVIQIALADDHWMYNKYGSIAAVENHNMTVINNVATNYDTEFNDDLQFSVVQIFISTSVANDPWTQSLDIEQVLNDFTGWGPSGFSNTHDVASLWSGRNFNGSVIGLAWVGAVCSSYRYNVLEDFSTNAQFLRVLQAHELGHNFNADHDAAGSNTIMAPAVNSSTTWSTASQNAINGYISQVNCLGPCQAPQPPVANFTADPTEGCTPLVVYFDDQSLNNPTSWTWSFPGGTPSSSTLQNPVVTYNTAGNFNVTLTVSNAQGSNAITKTNFITVLPDPIADFDYSINLNEVDFTNLSLHADSYLWNFGDGNTSTLTNPLHVYDEDGIYTVTLTAFNDCGADTYTITIEILTPPTAFFDSDIVAGCEPFSVQFINLSSNNAESFEWSFPGGIPSTSTDFEPTVMYQTPGVYPVSLTAINEAGEDTYSVNGYITVHAEPSAEFTYSTTGLTVTFNAANSQGDTFFWTFGDGQTSAVQNPVHTYAASGTYTVTLTVNNSCGANSVQTTLTVLGLPVAGITANVQSGCPPLVVQFQSTSSGNPTAYAWVFEGGAPATSTLANPLVTYATPGTFDVQLTVTNNVGLDTLILVDYITVLHPAASGFSYSTNGSTASFSDTSAYATSWLWDFGDGQTSSDQNPTHTYTADGSYTVMQIAFGICGSDTSLAVVTIATPAQADFTWQFSGDCVPMTAQFFNASSANATSLEWIFPGGSPSSSTALNPVVTYSTPGTYTVTLIANAPAGADTLVWSGLVQVGAAPDAAFLLATNDVTVTFTNQSVGANSFLWNFGDGQSSTEANPVHTYPGFGTYTVTMIATGTCGLDTSTVTIVLGSVPNALFLYSGHIGCAPFSVQFTDQSQNSPTAWLWTFEGGDPPTSEEQNPLVQYAVPGDYFVSLRVTNGAGTDVLVLDDVIQVSGSPDAAFTFVQAGNTVSLEYTGTDYDSLRWNFGDGRTDVSLNPTVNYPQDGTYEISLIVFNSCGADTSAVLVNINTTSTADAAGNPDGWTLFPNPFGRELALAGTPREDGRLRVEVFDTQGKRISLEEWTYAAGPMQRIVDTRDAVDGLIFVVLNDGKTRRALRAIKSTR